MASMNKVKKCSKCKKEKEIVNFGFRKDRGTPTAPRYTSWCLDCRRIRTLKWRGDNPDKNKQCKKNWEKRNPERYKTIVRGHSKRYRIKYPEKTKAHSAISHAIRDGKITRNACSVCGTFNNVEGHHSDYSKPFEVIWLCMKHHKEKHGIIKGCHLCPA